MLSHHPTYRRGIFCGFALIIAYLVINSAVSLHSADRVAQGEIAVAKTSKLLKTVAALISALKDAETGQRGYLITGNVGYLVPYNKAVKEVEFLLLELDEQAIDHPQLTEWLVQLKQLTASKLSEIERVLTAYKKGFAEAQRRVATNVGKDLMDLLRLVIQQIEHSENEVLIQQSQVSKESLWNMKLNIVLGLLTGFVLVACIGFTMQRGNQQLILSRAETLYNEKRYRTLIDAVSEIAWNTPANGAVTGELPSWSAYTGQSTEEIAGWGWLQAVHPEDQDHTRRIWTAAVAERSNYHVTHRLRRYDGVYRTMSGRGVPVLGADGNILEWIGVHTDITEQQLAEAAVIEAERFSRSTLDSLSKQIAILDDSGKILAVNKAWSEFAATNSAKTNVGVGANYLQVCDEGTGPCGDEADAIAIGIRAVIAGNKQEFHLEYPCHSPTERRWYRAHFTPFSGEGTVRVVICHENITAAKLADEERQKFVSLVENSIDFIGLATLSGEVIYTNPAARELVGLDSDRQQIATQIADFHTDADKGIFQKILPALQTSGRWAGEMQLRHFKTNRAIDVQASAFVVRHPKTDEPLCIANIARDITLQKQADETMHQAKIAAEEANRAKSEFLANMSHEIRTPMNGVLGMTEILLESELTSEQRESLGMVKSSAESLMTVINDILDFSKIEAGKLDLESLDFPLRSLLEDTLKPLALRAHRKGLELSCDLSADLPEFVVGDPNRLRQVLINLVGNAIKFTESGEVVLQAKLRGQTKQDYEIDFAVIDTGIGIPENRKQAIFAPFSQADGSTTRRFGGTGLGLTISSQLVTLMGGHIEVDSKIGLGSTFRFSSRFARSQGLLAQVARVNTANLRGTSVLIVDDNSTNRRILADMLQHWEALPSAVEGGEAALAEMARAAAVGEPYTLVLVDAVMPEMDGFTLVERIQREESYAPPTIMMLTSLDRQGDANRCRMLGMAAYLVKPIKAEDLYQAIIGCLDAKPAAETAAKTPAAVRQQPEAANSSSTLRVLLAEDNPINQRVALYLLQKQNYTTTVVSNGREALQAFEREPFDLVLMDIQMPEMDGFEATRSIRAAESVSGGHLPIIAMTAHAMKGDRERCLAAGMDDYVTKPIQAPELLRAIQNAIGQPDPKNEAAKSVLPTKNFINRKAVLAGIDGDVVLLQEIVRMFLEYAPRRHDEIRQAIECGDFAALRRTTHAFKGVIGYLDSGPVSNAINQLDQLAVRADATGLPAALSEFERHLEALTVAAAAMAAEENSLTIL
jgi:two-component system sensor histidine kinase/response regulator